MSSIGYERELGGVQEKLKRLEEEMSAMREDVREIRDVVVSVKGGWKTLAILSSVSAILGGIVVKLLAWLSYLPK